MSEEITKTIADGLERVSAQFKSAIERLEGQVQENGTASKEIRAEVHALAEQYKSLRAQMTELEKRGAQYVAGNEVPQSWGQQFVAGEAYKSAASDPNFRGRVALSVRGSTLTTGYKSTVISDGNTVLPNQRAGVVPGLVYPKTVRELIPVVPITSNSIETIREATWTNSAAEQNEALNSDDLPHAKAESEVTFEPFTVTIRTVAHHIAVSNQLVSDSAAIAAYIDMRLRDGLADRIEQQLISGNGTAPNLAGLETQAGGTITDVNDSIVDTANLAIWTLWQSGFAVDAIIVNPLDWSAVERLREGTNSGAYLYGTPGTVAAPQLFRVPVIPSRWVTQGEIGVCALRQSTVLFDRQAASVEMGYVNDDFVRNRITIRAEERLALSVDRPAGVAWGTWTT
jgi:HK97 family phage major capsid protein